MDQQDGRLSEHKGLRGFIKSSITSIKDGELGFLPVVVGLIIIGVIFQSLNSTFLSPANLSNLLMQAAAVGVIALGIVCVLLVGEIDLSVGSVSGLSAAIFAVFLINLGLPTIVGIIAAITAGAIIGLIYSFISNRFGVPSFVITLAGLLAFAGLQILVLKPAGTINIPFDSPLVNFGQLAFVPSLISYLLCALLAGGYFISRGKLARSRAKGNLSHRSYKSIALAAFAMFAVLAGVSAYLNQGRGIGWMFITFLALVLFMNHLLMRTSWGRSVFAVGGNKEAARRSGINVRLVYVSVFVACSTLAAIGGLFAAGRLASAAQSSGGGDTNLTAIAAAVIGGTSLFGGRGSAFSALLGVIVITAIANGLILLNLESDVRYMVTGGVLLLAVTLDAVSRRARTAHGRA
jgi:simple sugar transport system permease protein/D-xylose transport system permease protein